MLRLKIGESVECNNTDDLYMQEDDDGNEEYPLSEDTSYVIIAIDYKQQTIKVKDDLGNKEWYEFTYFNLDGYSKSRYERNLPSWF